MESKIKKDDLKERVIDDFVTNKDKRGKYWLVNWYSKNITQAVLENFIKEISEHETVKGHLVSIVGQIEIGESSKALHIHLSVTFKDSSYRPLPAFISMFGDKIYVNQRPDNYNAYCSKSVTRAPNTTPVYFGIDKKKVSKYVRSVDLEVEEDTISKEQKEVMDRLTEENKNSNIKIKNLEEQLDEQAITIEELREMMRQIKIKLKIKDVKRDSSSG